MNVENIWNTYGKNEENARFELRWPRDAMHLVVYGHQVMNYRYHWHPEDYEVNLCLNGSMEFCRGKETSMFLEDDVVVTAPGTGHASLALTDQCRTIVIHFSASCLKPYVKKGSVFLFPECRSDAQTRGEMRYKLLRFYAAQVYLAASSGSPYAQQTCKAALEMLISTLVTLFHPVEVKGISEEDSQVELMRTLIEYMEKHYAEKITLEDLANVSGYNRTYVSTLFKNVMNVNFHEYLSRIRFMHALSEIALTSRPLTEIAIDNGFSDLKTFNAKFKEFLHRTPAEYRAQLDPDRVADDKILFYVLPEDAIIQKKVKEYTQIL